MGGDGWDTKPKLDEARFLAPEQGKPSPGKKDRRHWCRGKVGVEHVTEIVIPKNHYNVEWNSKCGYSRWRKGPRWSCRHVVQCTNCGKILDRYLGKECPDWYPRPELPQVCIDLNVRVEHNWTFTSMEDVDRPVHVGDRVEVYEEESGIRGPGRIERITPPRFGRPFWANQLVYISVEWKKLRAPDD